MQQHHCTRMRLMCRIEILLRKSKRKSDSLHHLAQYRQTRFMKNHNCFTEIRQSSWPVPRRKVSVIGRSESLLDVCGLRRLHGNHQLGLWLSAEDRKTQCSWRTTRLLPVEARYD